MQPFLHSTDASYKIWSTLANWPQRYSTFIWIKTEWQNHKIPEGQGKSSIAPTFSTSGAIITFKLSQKRPKSDIKVSYKSRFIQIVNELELPHDKTNKMTCAPSEDSDQPGHLLCKTNKMTVHTVKSLIRLSGCPGWSESMLDAHVSLLVLSCGGSFNNN